MRGASRSAAFFLLFALAAVACGREGSNLAGDASGRSAVSRPGGKSAPEAQAVPAALHAFADCGEVTKTLRTQALKYVSPYGLMGGNSGGFMAMDVATTSGAARAGAGDAAAPQAKSAESSAVAPGDHSETNVQEAGVDEPDIIETDGRRIFAISGQTLRAADISGDAPHLVGRLDLPMSNAQIMLTGNRLIVIGGEQPQGGPEPRPAGPELMIQPAYAEKTLVEIVDVTNAAAMKVESTLHLDGSLVSSRAVNGVARIVIRALQPELGFVSPQNGDKATLDRALQKNKDVISNATVEKWIPRFKLQSEGKSSAKAIEGPVSSCSTTYEPRPFGGFGSVSVVTVDPASPTPREGSTVVGGGEIVYASQKALYVTTTKAPEAIPLAAPAGAAGSGVAEDKAVAPVAPDAPVAQPISPIDTQIHKFDIGGDTANYIASGVVKGTLLNQFSMSELDGNLRVATTTNNVSKTSDLESAVSIFAQKGAELTQIGHVGGLGRGEQIQAVRFIGNVGYVVTFLQIDPLFTIDLSNPTAPKVSGELEMPGYSSYLHPIADGWVLGIGTVANARGEIHDAQGRFFGAKVSLFDVRDPAHPKEASKLQIAGASNAFNFDHHSFLYWEPRKLGVLPVQDYTQGPDAFVGAILMHIDIGDGVKLQRRITHPGSDGDRGLPPQITRTVISGAELYSLSDKGILATNVDSPNSTTWLPFS